MQRLSFSSLALASVLSLVGCASEVVTTPGDPTSPTPADAGKTFATAEAAPKYEGTAFTAMQIFDAEKGVYLDETALVAQLGEVKLVFFGEQHETAPVQELELWALTRMTAKFSDVSLAMEHFQRDEQPILDDYVAGNLTPEDFEKKSQPWPNYAKYWKPLVDHMKEKGRPVVGLNVPKEALDTLYAAYPKKPLEAFNALGDSFKYAGSIAPRPIPAPDDAFKAYFADNFDPNAHSNMGMKPAEALAYFTDLAVIRDETMGYFAAEEAKKGGRVLTVAGDFHAQTGLATPDRAVRYLGKDASAYRIVSTTPRTKLAEAMAKRVSDRKLARFWFVFDAK